MHARKQCLLPACLRVLSLTIVQNVQAVNHLPASAVDVQVVAAEAVRQSERPKTPSTALAAPSVRVSRPPRRASSWSPSLLCRLRLLMAACCWK